jgi:hypothetical protein
MIFSHTTSLVVCRIAEFRSTKEELSVLPVECIRWASIACTRPLAITTIRMVCGVACRRLAIQIVCVWFQNHVWRADIVTANCIPVTTLVQIAVAASLIMTMDYGGIGFVTVGRWALVCGAHSIQSATILKAVRAAVCLFTQDVSCIGLLLVVPWAFEGGTKSQRFTTSAMVQWI